MGLDVCSLAVRALQANYLGDLDISITFMALMKAHRFGDYGERREARSSAVAADEIGVDPGGSSKSFDGPACMLA